MPKLTSIRASIWAIATTSRKPESLSERFWSIARAREIDTDDQEAPDPVSVVNHVLAILDEVDKGHVGDELSVNTVDFLHLLRVHEMGGDLSYASPEQIGGSELDERSLVFSIGVLTVLMKAMGPFPEERWRSLKELRAALEYFADRSAPAVRLPGTDNDESTQIFRPGFGPTSSSKQSSRTTSAPFTSTPNPTLPARTALAPTSADRSAMDACHVAGHRGGCRIRRVLAIRPQR